MERGMEQSEGVPAAVEEVKQRAASGADTLRETAKARAERLGAGVGEHAGNIAQAIRSAGEQLRGKEDWLADAADGISRNLEKFSAIAREKGLDSIKRDVERLARERPALFVGAAVTAGVALGRLLRSTSPERGETGGGRAYQQPIPAAGQTPDYAGATSAPGASARATTGRTASPAYGSAQPEGERYGSE